MPTAIFKLLPTDTSSTACEGLKANLIMWAQNQATGHRTQAAIGNTKKHHDHHTHKAESFDFVAKYLEGMEIRE